MNKFKHSGTFGDLIYSLPLVKYFGGGEFYLHLDQINWIGQHYYGSKPQPQHQGRMTQKDFDFLAPLLEIQPYITKVAILDPQTTEITHNLDRFRTAFVTHPGNYVDIYATTFGIRDPNLQHKLRTTPWLTTTPVKIPGRDIVINRTHRWLPRNTHSAWTKLAEQGLPEHSLFVGTEQEYKDFIQLHPQWHQCQYYPTTTALDLAEIIAGSTQFIGNQSLALSLAIGLGTNYIMEARDDLPLNRNECYFPDQGALLQ